MGDATAPPTPSAVNTPYDIEEAINELVLDAGPVFFEHLQNWGAATVPDTLPARMHVRFGPEVRTRKSPKGVQYCIGFGSKRVTSLLDLKFVWYLQGTPKRSPPFAPLDPLSTPLPKAPRMRMYCGYGHGLPTERAYHYKHDKCDDDQSPASQLEAHPQVSLGQVLTPPVS